MKIKTTIKNGLAGALFLTAAWTSYGGEVIGVDADPLTDIEITAPNVYIDGTVQIAPDTSLTTDYALTDDGAGVEPAIDPDVVPIVTPIANTTPVYTILGGVEIEESAQTSGTGVIAETTGDLSLIAGGTDTTTKGYIRAVRTDIYNLGEPLEGEPAQTVYVGGFMNDNGTPEDMSDDFFQEIGELVIGSDAQFLGKYTGTPLETELVLNALDEAALLGETVSEFGNGGNLLVEGNATIEGTMTLGAIPDVEEAIGNINGLITSAHGNTYVGEITDEGFAVIGTAYDDVTGEQNIWATNDEAHGDSTVTPINFLGDVSVDGDLDAATLVVNGGAVDPLLAPDGVDLSTVLGGNTGLGGDTYQSGDEYQIGDDYLQGDSFQVGNSIQDGNATITGNLELGAITDVEQAILDNESDIAAEAIARADADTILQNNINAEATARANADTALQGQINTNVTDIDALEDLIWQDESGATHIGPESLVTQYDSADDDQNLWAENGSGDVIDINVITDLNVSPSALPGTDVDITSANGQVNPTIDPDLQPKVDTTANTTPVYTLLANVTETETDYTKNGGVLLETNGDVTLTSAEGTKDTVKYVTAVRADIYNADQGAVAGTTAKEVRVGGYLDANGDFVELAQLVDVNGQWLLDPSYVPTTAELTALESLGYVVEDEVITGTGGNLHVDGDAAVMGDLTVGGVNVMTAISSGDATTLASAKTYADTGDAANAANISSNLTKINTNTTNISSNLAKINVNTSDITSLKGRMTTAESGIAANAAGINSLDIAMDHLRMDVDTNTRGIAMVAALTHTTILPGMENALDISMAYFEGETGISISYSRRINDNTQINFAAASTSDFEESVVRGGIGWQW